MWAFQVLLQGSKASRIFSTYSSSKILRECKELKKLKAITEEMDETTREMFMSQIFNPRVAAAAAAARGGSGGVGGGGGWGGGAAGCGR
jgi:hypothetical protein